MSTSIGHRARPSVFGTAAQAWRSAWLAVLRMPLLMLVATLVLMAFYVCQQALAGAVGESQHIYQVVLSALIGLVPPVLLAPVAVAVHRFVLLGEQARLWPHVPTRVVLFFASWLVVSSLANSLAASLTQLPYAGMTFTAEAVQIGLSILYIRLVLMLPAIAVQSTQPAAPRSWRQTHHRFWRTTAVMFVAEVPLLAPVTIAVMLVWLDGLPHHLPSMLMILGAPLDVACAVVGAAALSWLFRRYDVADEPSLIPAAT